MLGLALTTWLPMALVCASGMGAGLVAFRALNESAIQQVLDPVLRGRVGTLSFMMMGAGTFAGLGAGALAQAFGPPATVGTGGCALLLMAAIVHLRRPTGLTAV